MRFYSSAILTVSLCVCSGISRAQTVAAQHDSSATVAASTAPADDPAFAGFQPIAKGMKPPKAVSAPDPKFPDLPQDAEQRGTVVMLIGVNTKGHVEAVRVLRSDEAAFEKTAVETVKKWKFKPAQKDGHAVPVQFTVEMKFER
jgi:protein TonB